jgi:hypothetical protein
MANYPNINTGNSYIMQKIRTSLLSMKFRTSTPYLELTLS